jgi:Fe(3+) dicitrate transport protein
MKNNITAKINVFRLAPLLVASVITPTINHADDGSLFIEEVTIIGEKVTGDQVSGSAHYIGTAELEQQGYSDIQRTIRQVPGVSVQVEDGYGLRPNLSIRGVATERSGRITLLEDNVLIAPAPYSAPSAYYFPTFGRMSAVEVLKGPAAITQGPYTIGGAVNMVSTPIPNETAGALTVEAGENSTYRLHGYYGTELDSGIGVLIETHQWQSDGFQTIDRGGNSGLDIEDYMLKLSYAPKTSNHAVEFKYQRATQNSDQSYLGLTDADFNAQALRRYGISKLDNIETVHDQVILRYRWQATEDFSVSATYYNNEHERDWYKTEGIDFDGSSDAQSFSRTSWSKVITAANLGRDQNGFTPAQLNQILDGTLDTAAGSIQLRSNARKYVSKGIQLSAEWSVALGEVKHDVSFGLRVHEDEEDRLQRNSTFSQQSGALVLDDLGLLGNAGNRVQYAEAIAIHVYDRIEVDRWVITPGLRYEDIDQQRRRWETRSSRTTTPSLRADASLRDQRQNKTQVWLPGIGASYQLSDSNVIFAGVHKGFTAPTNAPNVKEETAINYELGLRHSGAFYTETTIFLSDYDNLLGQCTASSGTDCIIGDAFNGEAATVKGLELLVSKDLFSSATIKFPASLTYTYIDSQFDTDIANTDFFGSVSAGDPIPYIPEHQANLSVGAQWSDWSVYATASYVDAVCVRASCGDFEKTDSSTTIDLAGHYQINETTSVSLKLENATDSEDILGRQPYGARPNKSRTASVGFRINL